MHALAMRDTNLLRPRLAQQAQHALAGRHQRCSLIIVVRPRRQQVHEG
jgi:hypothetical protein